MSTRSSQGSRGISSKPIDGFPGRLPGGSSSAAARRRASAGVGGSKGGSKQQRSLQEISIPEGMDEEVEWSFSYQRHCSWLKGSFLWLEEDIGADWHLTVVSNFALSAIVLRAFVPEGEHRRYLVFLQAFTLSSYEKAPILLLPSWCLS